MSKTDKTKPYNIQIAEDAVPLHDHSKGACDLPTLADWTKMTRRQRWTHSCEWQPRSWHRVKFSRSGGEKDYLADKRKHKYPDWKNN